MSRKKGAQCIHYYTGIELVTFCSSAHITTIEPPSRGRLASSHLFSCLRTVSNLSNLTERVYFCNLPLIFVIISEVINGCTWLLKLKEPLLSALQQDTFL